MHMPKADIIVFLVAHSVFKTLLYDDNKVILDFCGIYKKQLSRSPL